MSRPDGPSNMLAAPLLEARNISRRFGAVEALAGASLTVHRGEVVGLVGDNAAGKSTLAKIIAGVLQPDGGEIALEGARVSIPNPSAARDLGIATVFQDLAVADNLDVTANLFLGREEVSASTHLLAEGEMATTARAVLDSLGARIPSVFTPLRELSAGQRQSVAIARTLLGDPRLVVLDEPTASLSVAHTAEVLTHVTRLRDLGHGVIFISHNLNDVRAVADRIDVLRHGKNNGSFPAAEATNEELIAAITGATRAGLELPGMGLPGV